LCHNALPIVKKLASYLDVEEGSDFRKFFEIEMNQRMARGRSNITEEEIEEEIDWLKAYSPRALEAMVRDIIEEYLERSKRRKRQLPAEIVEIYA
jgi:hypothetical protein